MAESNAPEKKDRADASKAESLEGVEDAHILEEHAVAPPVTARTSRSPKGAPNATPPAEIKKTPRASAPAQQPPRESGAQKSSSTPIEIEESKTDFAKILEQIKLPNRNEAVPVKVVPPKQYDTSLNLDPAKAAAKEAGRLAALEQAQAAARNITETLGAPHSRPQDDVRALHTLKDDLQHVVRDKKISLVRAVALEEEKRHHGIPSEEYVQTQLEKRKRTHYGLFLAAILFFIGLLAIGSVLFIMAERTSKSAAGISAQVLFSEQSVPLDVTTIAPLDIRREIGNARNSSSLTLGAILQIVPVMRVDRDGQSVTIPLTFSTFLEKLGIEPPPGLARALSSDFFFGLHAVDENAPLIVIPVTSYENAFAAMLAWEASINADLSPMFTSVSMQAKDTQGLPRTRVFEDTVMRNYDVRALKDDSGTIQLYYSFPTRNILIIAESPYSFSEILSRLRADRRL